MPALLRARPRVLHAGSPQVDWSHPLTHRLLMVATPTGRGVPVDLVSGKRFTATAQKQGPTPIGQGSLFDGTTATTASLPLDLSAQDKITVSCWLHWDAFANDDLLAMEYSPNSNSANAFIIDPNSTIVPGQAHAGMHGTVNGFSYITFARPTPGVLHHWAVALDRTALGGVTVWIDGVQQTALSATSATLGGTFDNSTLYLMSRNSASLLGKGRMPLAAIHGRILSTTEVQRLYLDPYVPLLPQATRQRYWIASQSTVSATAASTLPSVTQAAAGTVTKPTYTGTASSTLPSLTQSAAGTVTQPVYTATAASVLPSLTQAASGTFTKPVYTGTATSTLPSLTQSATGTATPPTFTATAALTLPSVTQAAVGTFTDSTAPIVKAYLTASVAPERALVGASSATRLGQSSSATRLRGDDA